MGQKSKSWGKAVYSYIASRPADTWLHVFVLGVLPSFVVGVTLHSFWWAIGAGVFVSVAKEVADYFDPNEHTCEWRDLANGCIGALIGAVMALI